MKIKILITGLIATLLLSCATQQSAIQMSEKSNDLFIVDCLLPGQIRKLGQFATYLTARRAIKTSAVDCEIRGGEYVAYDRANYLTALNIWMPKAQAGEAEAQNYVGEIYEKGLGIQPDYEMAHLWYKKAALQGYSKAQMNLGFLYEKGLGVKQNDVTAMEWYRKSSNLSELKIPFATTITTEPRSSQITAELKLLKASLKNSQAESRTLKNKLALAEGNLIKSKSQLALFQNDAALVKSKINDETHGSQDKQELASLQQMLNEKTKAITAQQEKVDLLDSKYKKEIEVLSTALTDTQKRAEQISTELKKKNNKTHQAQVALLEAEAKLAATEKRLLEVDDLSRQRLIELNSIKSNKSDGKKLTELSVQKGEETEQKILKYEQEKILSQQTIARLQEENLRIRKAEQEIKSKILSEGLSNKKMVELSERLKEQEQLAMQTQQNIKQAQTKLDQTEKEKLELIAQIDSDKALKEKYLQDISSKTEEVESLRQKLSAEKQRYEAEINKLQLSAKAEATDKPRIEIIDPPFVLTRGVPTATLRSLVSHREIIGKIEAPAGLLSVSVNDQKSKTDKQGLFKKEIKLFGDETPVHVVAVDNKGSKSSLNFVLSLDKAVKRSKNTQNVAVVKPEKNWEDLDFGTYHALIIANNEYQKVPKLDTPETDARDVEKVLRSQYGFKTKLLLNGTRYQILSELNQLRATLTEKDNLLIYYAGHGELDKVNMRGHWLPVDADGDNTANWISTISITDILNSMAVKHVMVVSDSCYSGAMTRSSLARLESGVSNRQRNDWLKAMLKTRSRTVLTSGGLKPVMDGGGGQHSVFASAFIKALENNDKLLEGQALYRQVSSNIVAVAADYGVEQVPEYAPIRHAGHESGEFFFVPSIN